jgi:hypothetical protein
LLAAWLDDPTRAGRLTLEHCDGELASPLWRTPSFVPVAGIARAAA